jgi:alkylation response protein AidB-like acyl-CoA dehydrogenase
VDPKTAGIEIRPIPTRGIEGAGQFTVHLDNVHVPADQLIGTENEGAKALFNSLNPERILAAATALGMSEYLIQTAVDYARQRCIFGDRTIASYQAIQHPLAEVKIQVEAARLLTYRAAWSFDQSHDPARIGMNANMAKFLAADTAIETCDHAIQTLGGNGFSEEYGNIYYWEAARLLKTAPISREMILNFVAEHVLDMPRSY